MLDITSVCVCEERSDEHTSESVTVCVCWGKCLCNSILSSVRGMCSTSDVRAWRLCGGRAGERCALCSVAPAVYIRAGGWKRQRHRHRQTERETARCVIRRVTARVLRARLGVTPGSEARKICARRGAEKREGRRGQSRREEKAAEQSRTAEPRGGQRRLVRGDVGDAEARVRA